MFAPSHVAAAKPADSSYERILCVLRPGQNDEMMVETLQAATDFQIVPVFCFEDAVEEIANRDYTLLITEFNLSDMSAIDVLAAVNSMKPKISSIVLDDSLNPQHAIRAFRLGAIDYICRPVNLDFLLMRIGQEFAQREARQRMQLKETEAHLKELPRRDRRLDPRQRAAAFVLRRPHFVKINELLADLKHQTGATFAGLLDGDHNVVSAVGELGSSDLMTLKSVFANDYGIRKLSAVLDEQNFSHTFLAGENNSVFISDVGDEHPVSMVVVTPAESKPGMVVLWARRAAAEIEAIISQATHPVTARTTIAVN
jgi:ActR/RegA family two-component response regulator/predicted regulator of Ras-like GTPase activity (Roadblock/LC7/MglB family)